MVFGPWVLPPTWRISALETIFPAHVRADLHTASRHADFAHVELPAWVAQATALPVAAGFG